MYCKCMPLFSKQERHFLASVASLGYGNPFLTERITFEKAALGRHFVPGGGPVWSASVSDPDAEPPNVAAIYKRLAPLMDVLPKRMEAASDIHAADLAVYEESAHYFLYQRYHAKSVAAQGKWRFYREFLADWNRLFRIPGKTFETGADPAHFFASFRQVQQAFHGIYDNIIGNSMLAARLRASVWQSIFTQDMRRYRRVLYRRMGDFPTLIESELFGYRRGSFTGAIGDRKGWLEACPPSGSVFLDELGEMDLSIQVKLLRVIETRRFSAVGDTAPREFHGKLIAATNRDLPSDIRAGKFREDLYYRLCADLIQTPSLADQIRDSPQVLHDLLLYMTLRTVGDEAERALPEVEAWIAKNLPKDYTWPGNYRELEQCVRNVIIRQSYQPLGQAPDAEDSFSTRLRAGELTADELLAHYAARVYSLTGSYEEAARRMQLDRRTVKTKVEQFLASQQPIARLSSKMPSTNLRTRATKQKRMRPDS
jgi:hypothetical protein